MRWWMSLARFLLRPQPESGRNWRSDSLIIPCSSIELNMADLGEFGFAPLINGATLLAEVAVGRIFPDFFAVTMLRW
jgi:hypothetical protein